MNTYATAEAIQTILNADTTLTALATGGIKTVNGPMSGQATGTNAPYIVIMASSANKAQNAMRGDGYEVDVQVTCWGNSEESLATLEAMAERVFGDATLQTNVTPTYGLHRKMLTLNSSYANGWSASQIVCEGGEFIVTDDEKFAHRSYYKVALSRYRPSS